MAFPDTIEKILLRACREQPQKPFLQDEKRTLSMEEVCHRVQGICEAYRQIGLERGQILLYSAPRTIESALVLLSGLVYGLFLFPFDHHFPLEEAVASLCPEQQAEAKLFWEEDGAVLRYQEKQIRLDFLPKEGEFAPFNANPNLPAIALFTSGSTGEFKAAIHCQRDIIEHLKTFRKVGSYREDDVLFLMLALHRIYGIATILMGLYVRHSIYFPLSHDAEGMLQEAARQKITRLDSVPAFFEAFAAKKAQRGVLLPTLRVGIIAGAPTRPDQIESIERNLDITLLPVYGMSEIWAISGLGEKATQEKRKSTIGKPLSGSRVTIRSKSGKILPSLRGGEIHVSSPCLMMGYFSKGAIDRSCFLPDGSFPTGDLGYFDAQGYLHITGRKEDIVMRNGVALSCLAIETKVCRLANVKSACLVGIPSQNDGEVPALALVLKKGASFDEAQLSIVLYKSEMPAKVLVLPSFPLLATGKINKKRVKELFLENA